MTDDLPPLINEPRVYTGPNASLFQHIHDYYASLGGFIYPPATEEQLRETESLLDIMLLPLLRDLYLQVANGGIGPGYGLYHFDNRHRQIHHTETGIPMSWGLLQSLDITSSCASALLSGKTCMIWQHEFPLLHEKTRMLSLNHLGCGTHHELHLATGWILYAGPSEWDAIDFSLEANTVEDYFSVWLQKDEDAETRESWYGCMRRSAVILSTM